MSFPKTVAFLISVLGFIWVYIQVGGFLHERVPLGPDPLFWALWTSFLVNLGLVAYLFDTRGKRGGGNPPPAPPQPCPR